MPNPYISIRHEKDTRFVGTALVDADGNIVHQANLSWNEVTTPSGDDWENLTREYYSDYFSRFSDVVKKIKVNFNA